MDPFDLRFDWSLRARSISFDERDYIESSAMFLALRKFLARYEGTFVIQIAEVTLQFDLDPDLSTVFEEIPEMLRAMSEPGANQTLFELSFFEQGTDISLHLERNGPEIAISIRTGSTAGPRFTGMADRRVVVSQQVLLEKWSTFLGGILNALISLSPTVLDDPDFVRYQRWLPNARQ